MFRQALAAAVLLAGFAAAAETVKVSDFHPEREDATAAIQAALDSGADTVIFDQPGFEYLANPLQLRSNQTLRFADGVTVRAMPGGYHGANDSLFTAREVANVTLEGEGSAVLTMNRKDYDDPARYSHAEWRHAVSLLNAKNVTIRNLSITESGGDGVYVGARGPAGGCHDILLEDLKIERNYRQAVSVISVENLTIRRCLLSDTDGTAPKDGIDFEPNTAGQYLVNCLIEDCRFTGNANNGIEFAVVFDLSRPISAVIRNCTISGNQRGINLITMGSGKGAKRLTGSIEFENCTIQNPAPVLGLCDQSVDGVKISFRDCVFDARGSEAAPINFNSRLHTDIGNIDFGNTVIRREKAATENLVNASGRGMAGFGPLAGSITVQGDDGNSVAFDPKTLSAQYPSTWKADYDQLSYNALNPHGLVPVNAVGKAPARPLRLRYDDTLLLYGRTGEAIELHFKIAYAPHKDKPQIKVAITDASGVASGEFQVDRDDYTYRFVPTSTGMFMFHIATRGETLTVSTDAPGQCYAATPLRMSAGGSSELYFVVPADCDRVALEISSDPNEFVEAELFDADGVRRAKLDRFAGRQILEAERTPGAKDEVWKLRLFNIVEDHCVRLAAPLDPILYTDRANLLRAE